MNEQPPPEECRKNGTLLQPEAHGQREAIRRWRRAESGMDGDRAGLPERPDDPVAYKLLDAAGDAMGRGDWRQGVNILRLVVRDYRHSREAACARKVIDRLSGRATDHGR